MPPYPTPEFRPGERVVIADTERMRRMQARGAITIGAEYKVVTDPWGNVAVCHGEGLVTLGVLDLLPAPAAPAEVGDRDALAAEVQRLRFEIAETVDMIRNCAGVPPEPDSLPRMVLYKLRQALAFTPTPPAEAEQRAEHPAVMWLKRRIKPWGEWDDPAEARVQAEFRDLLLFVFSEKVRDIPARVEFVAAEREGGANG